jgi:hypothetical protein
VQTVPEPIDPVDLLHSLDPKQYGPYRVSMDHDTDMQLWDILKRRLGKKGEAIWSLDVLEATIDLNGYTASQFALVSEALLVRFKVCVNRGDVREITLPVWSATITGLTPLKP